MLLRNKVCELYERIRISIDTKREDMEFKKISRKFIVEMRSYYDPTSKGELFSNYRVVQKPYEFYMGRPYYSRYRRARPEELL